MNAISNGMLKIASILFIIFGGIGVLEIYVQMDYFLSLRDFWAAVIVFYVLAMCTVELVLGILGLLKYGKPAKANFFILSGAVIAILCGVNIVRLILLGGFDVTYLINIVLSVLFVAGGIMRKKSIKTAETAAPKPKAHRILSATAIAAVAVAATVFAGLQFVNQSLTIMSVKKIDNYPLYSITYFGDYNLDYEVKNPKLPGSSPECTSFLAFNGNGEPMLCRNLDNALAYDSIAILKTNPPGKCATISITDLYYMGYAFDREPTGSIIKDRSLLNTPRVVIDGMNEYGVAFAVLSVPHADPPIDPNKKSTDDSGIMRLALDKAKNVDEAVDVIKSYNIVPTNPIHFMIADADGNSVIVEFEGGKIITVKKTDSWQAVTNFIVSSPGQEGDGQDRYKIAEDELAAKNGRLTEDEAMALLKKAARPDTHWSIIYNLRTGDVRLALAQNYENILKFKLQMHS